MFSDSQKYISKGSKNLETDPNARAYIFGIILIGFTFKGGKGYPGGWLHVPNSLIFRFATFCDRSVV